jgi:hypothetical protein
MFKKIIWATDGSDPADLTLPLANTLTQDAGASCLSFTVRRAHEAREGWGLLRQLHIAPCRPWSAIVAVLVLISGYIIAVALVVAISGGWAHTILLKYLSVPIP